MNEMMMNAFEMSITWNNETWSKQEHGSISREEAYVNAGFGGKDVRISRVLAFWGKDR